MLTEKSPFSDTFRMEAVVLCGIQGAGKSTLCHRYYADSHIRINYDMLRTRNRESILLAACIKAKQPFVVDATNPTASDRARYLRPAAEAGFYLVAIEFVVPFADALHRNAQRQGKSRIPDNAIRATRNRFETPSFSEGFDGIWQAQVIGGEFRFREVPRVDAVQPETITRL